MDDLKRPPKNIYIAGVIVWSQKVHYLNLNRSDVETPLKDSSGQQVALLCQINPAYT